MRRILSPSKLALIGSMLFAGVNAPAIAFPESSLANVAALEDAGFRAYWTIQVPLASGESVRSAYLIDENVYVVSDQGLVFSVEAATGLIRWADEVANPQFRIYKPTQYRTIGGRAVVGIVSSSSIKVLDRYSGDHIQEISLPFPEGGPALGFDGKLFMGSYNGRVYSLFPTQRVPNGFVQLWEVATGGAVTTAPIFDNDDNLVFASYGGHVFSCSAVDKTLYWASTVGGAVHAELASDIGGIYVASQDRSLYKLNSNTGAVEWRVRFPWELDEGPAVVARTAYQYSQGQGLTALDADTGSERWKLADGRNLAAHSGERDFVFTTDRRLAVIDHVNGSQIASISAGGAEFAITNVDDDAIYLFGSGGEVLCARPDSVPYLRRQQILAAKKQLNLPPGEAVEAAPTVSTVPSQEEADPFRSRWDRKKK